MSARRKRRSFQHIMEDQSFQVVKEKLPKEWAIHDYKPDYGIDFVGEIFEYVANDSCVAETLGELFFVQLKSVQITEIERIKVFPRFNVEKKTLSENKAESLEIEVIKFNIDTNELLTIQSMGSGIPVLLFLVSLDQRKLFFVCLNDLIEKVISVNSPDWMNQDTKTIYIPLKNEVFNEKEGLIPLRFYGKRSKWYSAFIKFAYQANELENYLISLELPLPSPNLLFTNKSTGTDFSVQSEEFFSQDLNEEYVKYTEEIKDMLLHFIERLWLLEIWESSIIWPILKRQEIRLKKIEKDLRASDSNLPVTLANSKLVYRDLKNLANIYEEHCREWYLPTYYSYQFFE